MRITSVSSVQQLVAVVCLYTITEAVLSVRKKVQVKRNINIYTDLRTNHELEDRTQIRITKL